MVFLLKMKRDIIKKIPLAWVASEDVLTWPHSHDGRYTCKLGYRFLEGEADMCYSQLPLSPNTKLWKCIWFLWVPYKVKNSMWCACRNAMPTKASLVRRTVIDDHCVITAIKSTRHLCMLSGSARSLIRSRMTQNYGPFNSKFNSWTSKNYYHGSFAAKQCGTLCYDGLVDLDTKQSNSPPLNSLWSSSDCSNFQR